MRSATLPLPAFGFIIATRAALAAGLALLLGNRIPIRRRRLMGLALVGVGAASTIPAARWLRRGLSRRPQSRTVRTLNRDSWTTALDRFSRQHEGWLVSIKTRTPDGRVAVDAHGLPLQGVSRMSHDSADIAVSVGDGDDHLTREVRDAVAMHVELTDDLAERALVIASSDRTELRIEFLSPARSEEVDGIPQPGRS